MTTCTHGHDLTPENIVIRHGRQRCRTCEHEHGRRYREKQRAGIAAPVAAASDECPICHGPCIEGHP